MEEYGEWESLSLGERRRRDGGREDSGVSRADRPLRQGQTELELQRFYYVHNSVKRRSRAGPRHRPPGSDRSRSQPP